MKKFLDTFKKNPFHRSLGVSWKEGSAASFMQSLFDDYITPLGLFLGASPLGIGFLVAIPGLLSSLSQFAAVKAVDRVGSRLRFLVGSVAIQSLCLVPIALFACFHFPNRIVALIVLVSIFRILGSLISTVWGGLTSDYLPPEDRGKYFGWRSRITGAVGVCGTVFGGILLFCFRDISVAAGFVILFGVAALARAASAIMMTRMQDLPLTKAPGDYFTFFMFLRRFRQSNFVKFVAYVASITFTTNLAAPFFAVYMLQDLKFNYLVFMFLHFGALIAGLLSFPVWGKHADAVGNARVLKLNSFLIPLIPILWALGTNLGYLFCVEFFAGFVWGGFNLCSLNFIYDAVTPGKRIRCLSYFTFINGIATFLGALIGGYLVERAPPFHGSRILTVFLLSGVLRFASHFILSRHFHEVRVTAQKVSSLDLFFSVVGLRPAHGRQRD